MAVRFNNSKVEMNAELASSMLYDRADERSFKLDYPGLTSQDLLDFCEYFKVTFYSLKTLSQPPEGMGAHDMFRVATNDFPSRGLDITFRSVVSWKRGRDTAYTECREGDVVQLKGVGLVTVVGTAEPFDSQEGTSSVIFKTADGVSRFMGVQRFTGMSYDRETDSYSPNAVRVH